MLRNALIIILLSLLFANFGFSQNINNNQLANMHEVCADEKFVDQFGNKFQSFLSFPVKTKIYKSLPYQWSYEECELQYVNKPISFNLKNTLYKEDLNEITVEVFEKCADERYVIEYGDTYDQFLDLNIKKKMKTQIEYEWFVEGCEEEYKTYPIKFKLKYY